MAENKIKKVCKSCGFFTTENKCDNCGSEQFVEKFKGKAFVLDVKSEIAEKIGAKEKGTYAIKY